jgi:hypothetical protein
VEGLWVRRRKEEKERGEGKRRRKEEKERGEGKRGIEGKRKRKEEKERGERVQKQRPARDCQV